MTVPAREPDLPDDDEKDEPETPTPNEPDPFEHEDDFEEEEFEEEPDDEPFDDLNDPHDDYERARNPPVAHFLLRLASGTEAVAAVSTVVGAIQGIVMAGVRAALIKAAPKSDLIHDVRHVVFGRSPFRPPWLDIDVVPPLFTIDPFSPEYAALQTATNEWIKRSLLHNNKALYERLFSFAYIARAETRSPLMIDLGIVLGAVTLPAVLVVGILRAVAGAERISAETRIRGAEATSKEEEAKQRAIQTEILMHVRDAVRDRRLAGRFDVPLDVLQAATTISSPHVADLSSSALIENVSLSVTRGK